MRNTDNVNVWTLCTFGLGMLVAKEVELCALAAGTSLCGPASFVPMGECATTLRASEGLIPLPQGQIRLCQP